MTKEEIIEHELDEIISGLTVIRAQAKQGKIVDHDVILYYYQHLRSILGYFPLVEIIEKKIEK